MILFKIIFVVVVANGAFAQLLVDLPNGKIQGHELQTFTNRSYYGYQGIPYATPPLGQLRFQAPQPAQNWTGIKETTKDSHICFQLQSDSEEEDEDCLYINVFTPILNRDLSSTKLPVLFWIYGGGLRNGAATFDEYRPDYWIDEDIILVTHNYRVGIFGFLSTGDEIIPGNNGLKDQVLALQWTYENIHLFGGDKDRITVYGQSAGSVSASYHMLFKQSAGLFRSVISESGSPLNMYSFLQNPKEYAIQLTQAINPNITSNATSAQLRDFLLSLDARTIDSFSSAPEITQPAVTIEPNSPSAVVTMEMYEMFESGNFTRVPILMGFNSEECLYFGSSNYNLVSLGYGYDEDPTKLLPDIFPHDSQIDEEIIGHAIKRIYLNENDSWVDHPGRVVRLSSDQRFTRAIIKQGKLISKYAPVYLYEFSYDGDVGGWDTLVEDAERVEHAEELYYIFLNKDVSEVNESDALTHRRLIRMWTNFIKYGNPTPEPMDLLGNITWPTVSPTWYQYLNIDDALSVQVNPKEEFFGKWEKIYETYGRRPFATY